MHLKWTQSVRKKHRGEDEGERASLQCPATVPTFRYVLLEQTRKSALKCGRNKYVLRVTRVSAAPIARSSGFTNERKMALREIDIS